MSAWYLECDKETTAQQAAIMHAADSASTRAPRDLAAQAMLIRGSGNDREFAISRIRKARAEWLTYLTLSQRKWQGKTRRPARARHHDSITIRESYVRF